MSAKILTPIKQIPATPYKLGEQKAAVPPKAQTFLAPKGQAPTPPLRQAPKPVVTHQQLMEAFHASLKQPEDKALASKFLKLFVDAEDPNFKTDKGRCPLHALLSNNRLDLVKAFVTNKKFDHGAVDENGETALFSAMLRRKTEKTPDALDYVTELLKVVPVNKVNSEGETVKDYLEKQILSQERRKNVDQAKYLRESVLPLIEAKIAEEEAAFEAEVKKRVAPLLRRADLTEKHEKEHYRKVTHDKKTLEEVDKSVTARFVKTRPHLENLVRATLNMERRIAMETRPSEIQHCMKGLEEFKRLYDIEVAGLLPEAREGQQLSSSPTKGQEYSGSHLSY